MLRSINSDDHLSFILLAAIIHTHTHTNTHTYIHTNTGAFNSTLDSVERSNRAQKSVDGILDRIDEIRKNRMHIEVYILDRPTLIEFNKTYTSNEGKSI